jgi:hypothetical protein
MYWGVMTKVRLKSEYVGILIENIQLCSHRKYVYMLDGTTRQQKDHNITTSGRGGKSSPLPSPTPSSLSSFRQNHSACLSRYSTARSTLNPSPMSVIFSAPLACSEVNPISTILKIARSEEVVLGSLLTSAIWNGCCIAAGS